MATQFFIKQSGSWIDFSDHVLKLGNFDLWLHNYDFSLRIPICSAILGYNANFEVGEFAKIVQDGKNIFPCYISSSVYDEITKEYTVQLTHVFGKLKEQKLLWGLDASFNAQLPLQSCFFDQIGIAIRGYKIFVPDSATDYNPLTVNCLIAYILYNYCDGAIYRCKSNFTSTGYTCLCRTMFSGGTEILTGAETYQDKLNIANLFDILDYVAHMHTQIVWDSTNEKFIFYPYLYYSYISNYEYYTTPASNYVRKYQEKTLNYDKKVIFSGRTDNWNIAGFNTSWYLDATGLHEWSAKNTDFGWGSENEIQNYNMSKFNHFFISYTTQISPIIYDPWVISGLGYSPLEQLKLNRFNSVYTAKIYQTDMAYNFYSEYYINIADIKAVFTNGIYNAEITLIEEVS